MNKEQFLGSEAARMLAQGSNADWISDEERSLFAQFSEEDKARILRQYALSTEYVPDVFSKIKDRIKGEDHGK